MTSTNNVALPSAALQPAVKRAASPSSAASSQEANRSLTKSPKQESTAGTSTETSNTESNNNNDDSSNPAPSSLKNMRKSISADDLLLLQGVTSTTEAAERDDDDGSVYSVASDWVMATFFPSTKSSDKLTAALMDSNANLDVFDDDDTSTTSSVHTMRYFEPSDFKLENWEDLSPAQIGFAMVAGGFMCFHPVMFVAGVLTAFGTLHAAGATYDYCENSSTLLFCGRNDTTTSAANDKTKVPTGEENVLSDAGQAPTLDNEVAEEKKDDHALFDDDEEEEGDDSMRQVSQLTFSEDSGNVIPQKLIQDILGSENNGQSDTMQIDRDSSNVKDGRIHSSLSALSHLESQEALQWVDTLYPSLPTKALDRVEFHGLNAKEFFNVFFSDSAPFGFEAFHNIRRDKNVRYGQWETLEGVQKPCLLSQAPDISHDQNGANVQLPPVLERVVEYDAKTNSFLGPPFAKTTKVQRALQVSKRLLVLEMKTTLSDIPFSNRFYIMERWLVTSESHTEDDGPKATKSNKKHKSPKHIDAKHQVLPQGSSTSHHHKSGKMTSTAFLTITSQVVFTQQCTFEATILKESAKQISDISNQWNKMAQEGLKRTEEARRQRLRDKEFEEDEHDEKIELRLPQRTVKKDAETTQEKSNEAKHENDESIEIQHMGRRNSWVAGDPFCPSPEEEHDLKDLSLNARLSKVIKSRQQKSKSGRRSLSRSLSNLIARRRSSTLSTVSSSANGTAVSPSNDTGPIKTTPLQIPVVSVS